ncbi:MAG: oxidoreductase, 2OG-Fe(II) oxygenase family protein [Bacteroidetes bacterium]|nr:oxidoreductase, 2OG-Fe(II) oxygenase family protein [Bacteroidota bacterium]
MDLFNNNEPHNLLPYDGEVIYYGKVITNELASLYFENLLHNIEWKNDEAVIFGKHIITDRKVAWYADMPFNYTYSGATKKALPWTRELLELKKITEKITGTTFNSCLLNRYHTGNEGMAWHSDNERALDANTGIASLTLGAARKFAFKHKRTREYISLILDHGSLLLMKGPTQKSWLHRLPPTTKIKRPRINLTFRTIIS